MKTRFPAKTTSPPRPAIFLDRDDTLIENSTLPDEAFPGKRGDLFQPEWVRLLPGARDACVTLVQAGFALIVVTNQGCMARGSATEETVESTNQRMLELLAADDGTPLISGVYAAPHHPEATVEAYRGDHPWRKPNPGMILAAAFDLHLDIDESWLVGDALRDVEAGLAAGIHPSRCIRVGPSGDFPNLAAAAERILERNAARQAATAVEAQINSEPATTVTLRARSGEPLRDAATRATVESVARAIAERTGVELFSLSTDDASITATLATHRLGATAFMAELRQATNAWHEGRGGESQLWP